MVSWEWCLVQWVHGHSNMHMNAHSCLIHQQLQICCRFLRSYAQYAVHEFGSMCFVTLTSNFVKNFPCKSCPDKSFLEGRNRNCNIVMDCQMPLEFIEVGIRISSIDVFDGIHCSHANESRPSTHQRLRRSYRAEVVKYLSPSVEAWTRDTENRAYILFSPASFPEPKSTILHITANVPVDHHSRGSMLWKRWEGGYKYMQMCPWAREDKLLLSHFIQFSQGCDLWPVVQNFGFDQQVSDLWCWWFFIQVLAPGAEKQN